MGDPQFPTGSPKHAVISAAVRQREYGDVTEDNRASASTLAPSSAHSGSRTLDEPGDGSAGTMSVLERLHRILGSATMSPRPDGLLMFPPPPSVRSGPDGDRWRAVDRAAPSVRPAPAVAARACLMIAGQDSSPIQGSRRSVTRVSALHRVDRWVSSAQPVDGEQVSRWETDGGRTRELTQPLLMRAPCSAARPG
jgi:hypothetical protein